MLSSNRTWTSQLPDLRSGSLSSTQIQAILQNLLFGPLGNQLIYIQFQVRMQQEESILSKTPYAKFKVVLIGDTGVGKSTTFKSFLNESEEQEYTMKGSTLQQIVDFRIKNYQIAQRPVKFYLWDTAGQERHRAMVSQYFKGCQAVVILYDITKSDSLDSALRTWLPLSHEKTKNAVIMLVANKIDLEGSRATPPDDEMELQCRQLGILYQPICALEGRNVNLVFDSLGKEINSRIEIGTKQLKQLEAIDEKCDYREQAQISISHMTNQRLTANSEKNGSGETRPTCKC